MKRRISQNQKGFTLAELSIALLVIMITLAIISPRLSAFLSVNAESVARRLSTVLRSCREHSIMLHKPYRIAFNFATQTYHVETYQPSESEDYALTENVFALDNTILHRAVKLPQGITCVDISTPLSGISKEGTAYIVILQDGLFPGAVVHLRDEDKVAYTLYFKPLTGRMEFRRGYIFKDDSNISEMVL